MATARNLLGNRWDLAHDAPEAQGTEPRTAGFASSVSVAMSPGPVAIRPATLSGVQRAELLVREAQALLDAAAKNGASYDLRLAQGLTESLLDRLEAISRTR